jgi:hypothetical protein
LNVGELILDRAPETGVWVGLEMARGSLGKSKARERQRDHD